jgi:Rrf2 family iron-sulfur cluster assembly transcriptional regulator
LKLTSKSRVAVTALADILNRSSDEFVSLSEISNRQNISLSFLEQLFNKLKKK